MFSSIQARNVQEAYVRGLQLIRREGQPEDTRNGPAMVIPWPVLTIYERPLERVLLDPVRDGNPFFHLQEGLWMLAGRNDVESIGRFLGGLKKYSDDGVTYHGAYGIRWRGWFMRDLKILDQLQTIIELLRANPSDRRIVLQMWDAESDLALEGKDFPCNTQCLFRVVRGTLQMTLFNRSNDAIWGAYGANAVHFSILQEFVAAACGLAVGAMYQWSNNLHAYTETLDKIGEPDMYTRRLVGPGESDALVGLTMYDSPDFRPTPLFSPSAGGMPVSEIFRQIESYWDGSDSVGDPTDGREFFTFGGIGTLVMARASYVAFKNKEYDRALSCARDIPAHDWRRACVEWLERRAASRDARSGPGQD